ncbi:MAG: hypothetical protein LBJ71_04410 [Holosporaceae bacterium]|nr:hypothetical protein [Holosporaceae bacterium]
MNEDEQKKFLMEMGCVIYIDEKGKKRFKRKIANFIKKIGADETCNKKFYSQKELTAKYPANWKYYKAFNQYPRNECISLFCGIDPNKIPEINGIMSENYENHKRLWNILQLFLYEYTSGKPDSYKPIQEKIILEEVMRIEQYCIYTTRMYTYSLSFFEETKRDFNEYHPDKTPIKRDKFREIVADLKGRYPEKYNHIPDSFLANKSIETERLFKNNQDFLCQLAISLKQMVDDQKENLSHSEATECISSILNIRIEGTNQNPCYNPEGRKAPKGFSYSTVMNAMKNTFDKPESGGNDSKEAKNLRKKKMDRIIPHLEGIQFDSFIEYFNSSYFSLK